MEGHKGERKPPSIAFASQVWNLNALPFLVESRDTVPIYDAPHALYLTGGADLFVASLHEHLKMLKVPKWIH